MTELINCQPAINWICQVHLTDDYSQPTKKIKETGNNNGWRDPLEADFREALRHIDKIDESIVREAATFIPAHLMDDYNFCMKMGLSIKSGLPGETGFEIWDELCAKSGKYELNDPGEWRNKWDGFEPNDIQIGTLIHHAKAHGYRPPKKYALNDIGNAARFADEHRHHLRYLGTEETWTVYNDKYWGPDELKKVLQFAKETAEGIYKEADSCTDETRKKALRDWAGKTHTAFRLKAMIELAKPNLAMTSDQFDTHDHLLNCSNGIVDLRTKQLLPHDSKYLITKMATADYVPGTADTVNVFNAFIPKIFDENQALIKRVQKIKGYQITGSIIEQKVFFEIGSGANGKTTLNDIIHETMGTYAVESDSSLLCEKKNTGGASEEIYRLRGVRHTSTPETNRNGRYDDARLKQLSGSEWQTARPLYGHFCTFRFTCKITIIGNYYPKLPGDDAAIRRRVEVIPFNVVIPLEERDPMLLEKLRQEKEGILDWLVEGAYLWHKERLGDPPDIVRIATDQYLDSMDSFSEFLNNYCVKDKSVSIKASALFAQYQSACRETNEVALPNQHFKDKLEKFGFTQKRTKTAIYWQGITLQKYTSDAQSAFADFATTDATAL